MDISEITDYLYVGAQPRAEHAAELKARNVRLIISMIGAVRPPEAFRMSPFRLLWLQTYDTPFTPIPIKKLVQGVEAALPVIESGGCVFVYCVRGRHRSVAMGAAILIAMGHSADEAMGLLRSRRETADPEAWHIRWRIVKFEKHWQRKKQAFGYQRSAVSRKERHQSTKGKAEG